MATQSLMRTKLTLYLDLIRWDRPAGWLLLLWPTLTALWLASSGFVRWHWLVVFVLGTVLMRSAGCCVNDVADQAFDRHVERTATRPITSGRISSREALAVGAILALAAFALVLTTNWITVIWSCAALAVAIAYPYAKRIIAMPQAILGLAFSFGIPMAFTAVNGFIDWCVAGPLMLANVFWVLAYDTEYAMVDREDDVKIGIKTSAITLGRFDVVAIMVFYVLHVLCMLWAFYATPLVRVPYTHWLVRIAVFIVAAQIVWHYLLIHQRDRAACFRAFKANHWIGFTWFCLAVLLCLEWHSN